MSDGPQPQHVTRLVDCRYLLVCPINYTLTNFAKHSGKFSHHAVNRYLTGDQIRPHLVWENGKGQVLLMPERFIIFDDTVALAQDNTHVVQETAPVHCTGERPTEMFAAKYGENFIRTGVGSVIMITIE